MSLERYKEKIEKWFVDNAESKKASWFLGIISFTESTFFPIPPDPFLIALLSVKQKRWFFYSTIVVFASVLGAIFGYILGFLFNEFVVRVIIEVYHYEEEFRIVAEKFDRNTFWTIFTAAFTPIPFKVFTVAGGIFKVDLIPFIIASILGRGIRFYIEGYVMKIFGKKIGELIFKYFNILTITIVLLIVIYILLKVIG